MQTELRQDTIETADQLDFAFKSLLCNYECIDYTNIRSFAAHFCRTFGLKAIPRDPFDIFPEMGIRLQRTDVYITGTAQWMRLGDNYVIEYTEYRSHNQLTLSLYHELFEMMSAQPFFPNRLQPKVECDLATRFAIHVSMPEVAVTKIAKDLGHPNIQDKTITIAHRFCVSPTAMRIRLSELGLAPRRNAFLG